MRVIKYTQAFLLLALALPACIYAQDNAQFRDARELMWKGDYDMALEALQYLPGSPEVDYMMATCVLLSNRIKNQPVERYLAFEEARSGDPLYYYWLGKIYLKRMHMLEAKVSFEKFLAAENSRERGAVARINEVTAIIAHLNAPTDTYRIIPLESPMNSNYSDINGVLYADQKQLVFASDRSAAGTFFAYHASKGPYGWDAPELLTAIPKSSRDYLNILPIGDDFFFFDPEKGELYSIKPIANGWSEPVLFKTSVLSKARHIYINKYKTRLIFSSENGDNGLDIYETLKLRTTGEWTAPLPISADLNTRYNEDYPFLSEDRTRLYFSSDRPGGLGKMDIYCSEFNGTTNRWGPAINLGISLNSMDNEIDLKLVDERTGTFSSDRVESRGELDIFLFTKND